MPTPLPLALIVFPSYSWPFDTVTVPRRRLPSLNPSGYAIHNVDAPLSRARHVLWGPTGTPWGRAEGCNM